MANANDKSGTYQLGTYITSSAVADGTITDNFNCGDPSVTGTTVCSGGVVDNQVMIYRIRVAQGIWSLETYRQASDSAVRNTFGDQPPHLKREKQNPLDFLKNGDRVMFRVETHKKLLGVETDIFVPFADNPNRETKFVGTFYPYIVPEKPSPPSDNVRAVCDAHKLSPELEKQFCTQPAVPVASANVGIGQTTSDSETSNASSAAALKAAGIELPPNAARLPTPQEATLALVLQMQAVGKVPSTDEMTKAYNDARAAEVKAMQVKLGAMVDPSELASIVAEQQAEQEAEQRAKQCPNGIQVGMSEDQVHACMGFPDHTNSDLSTDQLVYPDGTYVYVNRGTGRVENIQVTH
ncbi:MAG: hypothetical protein WCF30_11805 [Terracidiphilus sp.]